MAFSLWSASSLVFLLTFCGWLPQAISGAAIDFNREIRPILSDACFPCHGPDASARKAGLRLDLRAVAVQPAESGEVAIRPNQAAQSELVRRIFSEDRDEVMPPRKSHRSISLRQKELLRDWINQGAPYAEHWSFLPPKPAALPAVQRPDWPRNPLDFFTLARMEAEGMSPAPEAAKSTLIRRVTLDLTGLPATISEVRDFLADSSDQAYERVVDRLMATRDYAERRAQDWLDLARYADTRGFSDDTARSIWPYRDWVIRALQRNQPFDQFTIEQLAGDLLPQPTTDQLIATGFHRNAPQAKGQTYPSEEYRLKSVVDRVNTTATVWLGLTMGCAECHDHKFDPISQADFYGTFAIFNQIEHSGEGFAQGGPHLSIPSPEQAKQKAEAQAKLAALQASKALLQTQPGKDALAQSAEAISLEKEIAALIKQINQVEKAGIHFPVMRERSIARDTFIHLRGNFLTRGAKVAPGIPGFLRAGDAEAPRNRLEYARWLVSGKNPLVARVVVNRFWQSYFGFGLVRTPGDFGLQGEWPTHPELLDWLASEFVRSGWDMKAVHRLIVSSATYRQSAVRRPEDALRDVQNRWLSSMPRVRLPAEQIRDQALAVSGLLKQTSNPKSFFPPQPSNYWEDRDLPGKWTISTGDELHRKSLFIYWRRMALHPTMELLDAPSRASCTPRRNSANIPTQALVTLNDPIFVEAAKAFAQRILDAGLADDRARMDWAFQTCLSRHPEPAERDRFLAFIERQAKPSPTDLPALWASVATILLNLDETLTRP